LRVEVEDGGEGVAEQEVVGGSSGEPVGSEVGEAGKICFGEMERVEPVNAAFVSEVCGLAKMGTAVSDWQGCLRFSQIVQCGYAF
jgi:hypothetical protein